MQFHTNKNVKFIIQLINVHIHQRNPKPDILLEINEYTGFMNFNTHNNITIDGEKYIIYYIETEFILNQPSLILNVCKPYCLI